MNLVLKVVFYITAGINALIGMFYFVMTVWSLLFPPSTHYRSIGGLIFGLGCAVIICLLVWAYNMAMLQGKTGAGFSVLGLSYILWIPLLISLLLFGKGNWQ